MNPVLILTHNNLELTKKCVESVRAQDVETSIYLFDSGSSDGTVEWGHRAAVDGNFGKPPTLKEFWVQKDNKNVGVSRGWNTILDRLFSKKYLPVGHVLVLNNDTILPPWFYSELLSYDVPFVTGLSVDWLAGIRKKQERRPLTPNPDFSAFLIRSEAWEKVGRFDESLWSWCGDCDYHVRGRRAGVGMYKAFLPYFHQRSSTINNAPPQERKALEDQANTDRATFKSKWGVEPGTPEYAKLFE